MRYKQQKYLSHRTMIHAFLYCLSPMTNASQPVPRDYSSEEKRIVTIAMNPGKYLLVRSNEKYDALTRNRIPNEKQDVLIRNRTS